MNDYLNSLQGAWQETSAPTKTYDELPDGVYQVQVEAAQLKESKSGAPYLHYSLRVLAGQHSGRMIFKAQQLAPEGLPYLKADLELLQIPLENIGLLEETLPRALDALLDVKLKTNMRRDGTPAQNVYFNRLIRQGGRSQQAAGFTVAEESKLPWE